MGLFDLFKKKVKEGDADVQNFPKFKYLENARDAFIVSKKPVKCDCCGKETTVYYENGLYCAGGDVAYLCANCVASGAACEKFDGTFNDSEIADKIENPLAVYELERRTPTLNTWQEVRWAACCNDYCAFIKFLSYKDMKQGDIMEKLEETYSEEEEGVPFEELLDFAKGECGNLLLFRCEKCGKLYLRVDID